MTKDRENEMLKASQLYPKHQQKVFVDGVLWGDSHPDLYSVTRKAVERERKCLIDKACEWLSKHFYDEEYQFCDDDGTWIDSQDLIKDFRKAMEEQQ